jgi:hypothetical protein|tara:strand:- start:354 stop:629 length:276 start_codon:yes stop_codon:yes gene_type:complete
MKGLMTIVYLTFLIFIMGVVLCVLTNNIQASQPKPNAKFYDFSEQVIDGHIKKPTALYTDARQKVKFNRLLKLKKSFLTAALNSAKEPVFK